MRSAVVAAAGNSRTVYVSSARPAVQPRQARRWPQHCSVPARCGGRAAPSARSAGSGPAHVRVCLSAIGRTPLHGRLTWREAYRRRSIPGCSASCPTATAGLGTGHTAGRQRREARAGRALAAPLMPGRSRHSTLERRRARPPAGRTSSHSGPPPEPAHRWQACADPRADDRPVPLTVPASASGIGKLPGSLAGQLDQLPGDPGPLEGSQGPAADRPATRPGCGRPGCRCARSPAGSGRPRWRWHPRSHPAAPCAAGRP